MTDQPFSASAATQDDKVVAALAHALGPLIAIIVWATQKDKSPFMAFQSLQALVYQQRLSIHRHRPLAGMLSGSRH